jgi:hypothetical protein
MVASIRSVMPDAAGVPDDEAPEHAERGRSGWEILGIVLACVLVIGGLAMVALFILFLVAFSSYGSNK